MAWSLAFEQRAIAFAALLRFLHAEPEYQPVKVCQCCGFPTLKETEQCETCFLCRWEDDDFSTRRPTEPSAANREYSLVESRIYFEERLVCSPATEERSWAEYTPGARELKRLVIHAFLGALEHPNAAPALLEVARRVATLLRGCGDRSSHGS
jgi:hypothetical protein